MEDILAGQEPSEDDEWCEAQHSYSVLPVAYTPYISSHRTRASGLKSLKKLLWTGSSYSLAP